MQDDVQHTSPRKRGNVDIHCDVEDPLEEIAKSHELSSPRKRLRDRCKNSSRHCPAMGIDDMHPSDECIAWHMQRPLLFSPPAQAAAPVTELPGNALFFDIFSERCSEDGYCSDWTVEEGSPRKKAIVDILGVKVDLVPEKEQGRKTRYNEPWQSYLQPEELLHNLASVENSSCELACSEPSSGLSQECDQEGGFNRCLICLADVESCVCVCCIPHFAALSGLSQECDQEGGFSRCLICLADVESCVCVCCIPHLSRGEDEQKQLHLAGKYEPSSASDALEQKGQKHQLTLTATSAPSFACDTIDREHRKLCSMLWEARPNWKPKDLVSTERKLRRVGIETVELLAASLLPETLNERLQRCGESKFAKDALKEFTRGAIRVAPRLDLLLSSSEPRSRQRLLWDMLWVARPLWTPHDLAAADRKLELIGVSNVAALQSALAAEGGINEKLKEVGAKGFTLDTVRALKGCVHQNLRIVLQESRPLWTPVEVGTAEQKLAKVGVDSVVALKRALARGQGEELQQRLQKAGFKSFTNETMSALRGWLR